MFIQLSPHGSLSWKLAYSYGGKQKLLTFGRWPDVSIADARERRQEAKSLLARGIDPGAQKKAEQAARVM
jgi:hypothetical protein